MTTSTAKLDGVTALEISGKLVEEGFYNCTPGVVFEVVHYGNFTPSGIGDNVDDELLGAIVRALAVFGIEVSVDGEA